MTSLVGNEGLGCHTGDVVRLENDRAILCHDDVGARDAEQAERLVCTAGNVLDLGVHILGQLSRNTMDVVGVGVLNLEVVKLRLLRHHDFHHGKRAQSGHPLSR